MVNNKVLAGIIILLLLVGGGLLLTGNIPTTDKARDAQTPLEESEFAPQSEEFPGLTMVEVTNAGFVPQALTVRVGSRVNWMNKSGVNVAVHSDPHPTHQKYPVLNLGEFKDGSSVQTVFDKVGTYTYHNHLDPTMTGTVIVK